jgi:hypothetical protein
MSESSQFCKACSNRSDTLAKKWDIGFKSSPSVGGRRRTVSCVPAALKRPYCAYFLLYGKSWKFRFGHEYYEEQITLHTVLKYVTLHTVLKYVM